MWHIVIRGLLIGICTLASFTVLLTNTHSLGTARTGALITLVLSQLIHVFECKSEEKTLSLCLIFSNPFLLFLCIHISGSALFAGIWLPCSAKGIFFTAVPRALRVSCGDGSGGYRACWCRNNTKAFYGQKSPDVTVNAPQG